MKIENLFYILVSIFLLTGCTTKYYNSAKKEQVPSVFFIKNSSKNNGYRLSLAAGKLHLDPYGCIRLGDDTGPLVIWANISELEYSDSKISIINTLNNLKVSIGDEIRLGGGQSHTKPTFTSIPIPEICADHGYWIASPINIHSAVNP